jgi:hypothetical protein
MKPRTLSLLALLLLAGCADLVVRDTQVVWTGDLKLAVATIANVGARGSGPTAVYFDGDESPVSPNFRPQVQAEVGALAPGQSVTRVADFAPLARAENAFLGNVRGVTVRVDPKNLIREGNEANNTEQRPLAGPAYTCIDFNGIAAGTRYGTPNHAPGAVVFTQGAVRATVENFRYIGPGGTFNFADIRAALAGFGSGNVLHFNNINLDFDFTAVTPAVGQVVLKFGDYGGFENLAINGAPSPIYAGELVAAPSPLGGAIVASTATAFANGKRGALAVIALGGSIGHLRIGGQELFIDDLCYR